MSPKIPIDQEKISDLCRRWKVTELALFGSVLTEDFGDDSDVDVLVRFEDQARRTLFDLVEIREELISLFGREVDLLTWTSVERSRNPFRRRAILESAEVICAA